MTAKERRRANRRKKHEREAMLEMRNMCGNKDLTPYNAIMQMRTNGKAEILFSNAYARRSATIITVAAIHGAELPPTNPASAETRYSNQTM